MDCDQRNVCQVCARQFSKYTCPRCNARSCSLDCYKKHSAGCTESFYRTSAMAELKATRASPDEKRRMLDILQRVHAADAAEPLGEAGLAHMWQSASAGDAGSGRMADSSEQDSSDVDEDIDAADPVTELSEATRQKLLLRERETGEFMVSEADLRVEELAAFRRELASGRLTRDLAPWHPWWTTQEAQLVALSARGTARVAGLEQAGPGEAPTGLSAARSSKSAEPVAAGHSGSTEAAVPEPPTESIPPLGTLTPKPPSPLLAWQLLDIAYAYCLCGRLYLGDWAADPPGASETVLQVSAALSYDPKDPRVPLPQSGPEAVLGCLERAAGPGVLGSQGRSFAVGVLADAETLLGNGRANSIIALADLQRMLEAGKGQLSATVRQHAGGAVAGSGQPAAVHRSGGADTASTSDVAAGGDDLGPRAALGTAVERRARPRRRLDLAHRKLRYMLAWSNEQPPQVYDLLAAAAREAWNLHGQGLAPATAREFRGTHSASSVRAEAFAAQMAQQSGPQVTGAVSQSQRPLLIEELLPQKS